jgi:FMN-dependent NADH-azoreductase
MKKLLHIDSSPRKSSTTRQLSGRYAERWKRAHPTGTVVYRDLAVDPPPHLSEAQVDHFCYEPGSHAHDKPAEVVFSERLIDEVRSADQLLLAAPMHNFAPPSTVKAWLDHIVWAGHTYDPVARRGLVDTPAVVVLSRGGSYRPGSPREDFDFQERYLRKILEFIGIVAIEFVVVELTMVNTTGPDTALRELAERSLEDAFTRIDELSPQPPGNGVTR